MARSTITALQGLEGHIQGTVSRCQTRCNAALFTVIARRDQSPGGAHSAPKISKVDQGGHCPQPRSGAPLLSRGRPTQCGSAVRSPCIEERRRQLHSVHSYIKTTLANLGTASDTKQHSIPAPSGAGFVASPAVAAPGFVDVAIVFARPTSRQATHPTRGFAKLNLTGLTEEGLVAPPTPSQALVFPRRASPNDESKQKAPRPKPEMLANTPAYHLQQTETTTRKGRSVAWY